MDLDDLHWWYRSFDFLQSHRADVLQWYQTIGSIPNISKESLKDALQRPDFFPALTSAHAWVKQCENEALLGGMRHARATVDGSDYLLFRRDIDVWDIPAKDRFLIQSELSVDKLLDFHFDWISAVQGGYELCHIEEQVFANLRAGGKLRLGICSMISTSDLDLQFLNASDGISKAFFRILGHKNKSQLNSRIQSVLQAATESQVDVLIFPELSVTADEFEQIRVFLKDSNNHIKLVVAGSCHIDTENGFSNSCILMGKYGEEIFRQDKLNVFYTKIGSCEVWEPSDNNKVMNVLDAGGFRLAIPICIDYFCENPWRTVLGGSSLILVPAMTPKLARFEDTARQFGALARAVTAVANASETGAPDAKEGGLFYLPAKGDPLRFEHLEKTKSVYLTHWDIKIRDRSATKSTDD